MIRQNDPSINSLDIDRCVCGHIMTPCGLKHGNGWRCPSCSRTKYDAASVKLGDNKYQEYLSDDLGFGDITCPNCRGEGGFVDLEFGDGVTKIANTCQLCSGAKHILVTIEMMQEMLEKDELQHLNVIRMAQRDLCLCKYDRMFRRLYDVDVRDISFILYDFAQTWVEEKKKKERYHEEDPS